MRPPHGQGSKWADVLYAKELEPMLGSRREAVMHRQSGLWLPAAWLVLAFVATGCAAGGGASNPGTPVAITDVKMVAGRWDGLMSPETGRERDDFVEVTLREDRTYEAKSSRTIGVMDARGTYQISDGKLLFQGERSTGTGTLWDKAGERLLTVAVTTNEGLRYSARLSPKR